jgi:type VI secretion system protein ImpK
VAAGISLRHGPRSGGEGRTWERCVADVERVQLELKAKGLDDASCQHILTAQCALLDEAVKGRGVEDDACCSGMTFRCRGIFWAPWKPAIRCATGCVMCCVNPHQRRRFDLLPAGHDAGLLGSYRSLNDPERQKLVNALSEHVAPFTYPQTHPVLAESRSGRGVGSWLASWPVRIA